MDTFYIEHYTVTVEAMQSYRPGYFVTVSIKSTRPNAKYSSVYSLLMFPDDTPKDMAKRAFIHYKLGTKPDERVLI